MHLNKAEKSILDELLKLSGLPLTEEEEERKEDEEEENVNPEPKEDDKKQDEELGDEWEIKIHTGSRLKIKFYDTYVRVIYRGKMSEAIKIPSILRPHVKDLSSFINDVLSYVEKVS